MAKKKKNKTQPVAIPAPVRASKPTKKSYKRDVIPVGYDRLTRMVTCLYGDIYQAQRAVEENFRVGIERNSSGIDFGSFALEDVSVNFIKALAAIPAIEPELVDFLTQHVTRTVEELANTLVDSAGSLFGVMRFFANPDKPLVAMLLNGVWYPVPVKTDIHHTFFGDVCSITVEAKVHDRTFEHWLDVRNRDFKNSAGDVTKFTARDFLTKLNLKLLEAPEKELLAFQQKMERAEALKRSNGLMLDVESDVLVPRTVGWRETLVSRRLGTKESPETLIIESELEITQNPRDGSSKMYELPCIRAFSTRMKEYCYVDVDVVKEHVYDTNARSLVVLPDDDRAALDAVFDTKPGEVFGDLFRGRHGGVVILASGGPGVGKTLTAEVYAEYTKRPLYIMELGELGTSLDSVEANLQVIFERARRWNAILLFDEADIFLAKRQEDNLEQAAIVGTFLRLLDHYEGTFFLTTNREDVIDPAFRSRITLTLRYPALVESNRSTVWRQLLDAADLTFVGDLEALGGLSLNGRNIRNAVRVVRMLTSNKVVTMDDVMRAMKYIAR